MYKKYLKLDRVLLIGVLFLLIVVGFCWNSPICLQLAFFLFSLSLLLFLKFSGKSRFIISSAIYVLVICNASLIANAMAYGPAPVRLTTILNLLPFVLYPIVAILLAWISVVLLLCLHQDSRKRFSKSFSLPLVLILCVCSSQIIGEKLNRLSLLQAIDRAQPIVNAVKLYEIKKGKPPSKLDELVPNFIVRIPSGSDLIMGANLVYSLDPSGTWSVSINFDRGISKPVSLYYLSTEGPSPNNEIINRWVLSPLD